MNTKQEKMNKELSVAAKAGNLSKVKYLVEQGADIHANDDAPLLWAAQRGHLNIVKYLNNKIGEIK